jgi:hypothetical protein
VVSFTAKEHKNREKSKEANPAIERLLKPNPEEDDEDVNQKLVPENST